MRRIGFAIALLLCVPAQAEETVLPDVAAPVPIDAIPEGPSVDDRLAEIRRRVEAALVYPPIARVREVTGLAEVVFVVGPDRRAREVSLAQSSGSAVLDRAALRAVADAGTLPHVYGRIIVPVEFALH